MIRRAQRARPTAPPSIRIDVGELEGGPAHQRGGRAQARARVPADQRGRLGARRAGVPPRLRRARGAGPRVHRRRRPHQRRGQLPRQRLRRHALHHPGAHRVGPRARGAVRARSRATSPSRAAPTTSSGSTGAGSRPSTPTAASTPSGSSCSGARDDAPTGTFARRRVLHDRRLRREPAGQARARRSGSTRSPSASAGSLRVNATAYATEYNSAGVVREDDYDVRARRLLRHRGSRARRATRRAAPRIAATYENRVRRHRRARSRCSSIDRSMRLRENWTGFLLDVQQPTQSAAHSARGPHRLPLRRAHHRRARLRALARRGPRPPAGVRGRLLRARRSDDVDAVPRHGRRRRRPVPQPTPTSPRTSATSASTPTPTSTSCRGSALRGGVRADMFIFDVLNNCAVQSRRQPVRAVTSQVDQPCLSELEHGVYREPFARSATAERRDHAARHDRRRAHRALRAHGERSATGVRSVDPSYVRQGPPTPFISAQSRDIGVAYDRSFERTIGPSSLSVKSSFFQTHVGPGPHLQPDRGPKHARERVDAHGLVGRGARARPSSSTSRQRDVRQGDVRRHGPARALRAGHRARAATRRCSSIFRGRSRTSPCRDTSATA